MPAGLAKWKDPSWVLKAIPHIQLYLWLFFEVNTYFEITKLCETHFSFILLMTNDPKWSDTI